jgi:hypothetical protein
MQGNTSRAAGSGMDVDSAATTSAAHPSSSGEEETTSAAAASKKQKGKKGKKHEEKAAEGEENKKGSKNKGKAKVGVCGVHQACLVPAHKNRTFWRGMFKTWRKCILGVCSKSKE